jgi:2-hydroxychromene-2-carboxylate isomerase
MAADPISRLQFARQELDRVFGDGYAAAHPDVVIAIVQSAAADFAALALARAIEQVAAALLEAEPEPESRPAIVRAHSLRP